ncbi:MAG TPA: NAD(P)/FAD-dependent oxidoreductase [Terriglobales bacterium]|nr:NAD(P)/FAD-dependent oxidoreductase [Terriglobales bacterium]
MKYDIVIVGGGPSGSLAGLNLAGRGLRVLLLDRGKFPRVKPCGGGISYRMYARFAYIKGLLSSVPTNFVHKIIMESPSRKVVESTSAEPLYAMIRRSEFDATLLNACRDGGIEVREGCTLTKLHSTRDTMMLTDSSGHSIEAQLVIGADGVNSTVAVHCGLRRSWAGDSVAIDSTEETPTCKLSSASDTMYVYYGFGGRYGYAYVFPKVEHVNLGVGYLVDDYRCNIQRSMRDEHSRFLNFLKIEGVAYGESDPERLHSYLLPMSGPLSRVSTHRVLLAGDAGGFVNGFTAEGIYYAMVSGEHAAKAAFDAIKVGDCSASFLRRFDLTCDREIGQELRTSVRIQRRLLSNPKRIDKLVELARESTAIKTLFTDFAVGKLSYSEFRSQMISAAPDFTIKLRLRRRGRRPSSSYN